MKSLNIIALIVVGVFLVSVTLASAFSFSDIGGWFLGLFGGGKTGRVVGSGDGSGVISQIYSSGGVTDFDGISKVVSVPGITPAKEVSVAGWFRTDALTTGGNSITGSWVSKRNAFILDPETDGSVKFYVFVGGQWSVVSSPQNSIVLNSWEHWVGTYNGATLALYKNGALVASASASAGSLGTSGNLCIGSDCGIPNRFFQGSAGYISVYSDVLSASDVMTLFSTKVSLPASNVGVGGGGGGGTVPVCMDSDKDAAHSDGKNYEVKGTLTCGSKTYTDVCTSSTVLREYFYDAGTGGDYNVVDEKCPNGCDAGACKTSSGGTTPTTCTNPRTLNLDEGQMKVVQDELGNTYKIMLTKVESSTTISLQVSTAGSVTGMGGLTKGKTYDLTPSQNSRELYPAQIYVNDVTYLTKAGSKSSAQLMILQGQGFAPDATCDLQFTLNEGESKTVSDIIGTEAQKYDVGLKSVSSTTTASIIVDTGVRSVMKGSFYDFTRQGSFGNLTLFVSDVVYLTKTGSKSSIELLQLNLPTTAVDTSGTYRIPYNNPKGVGIKFSDVGAVIVSHSGGCGKAGLPSTVFTFVYSSSKYSTETVSIGDGNIGEGVPFTLKSGLSFTVSTPCSTSFATLSIYNGPTQVQECKDLIDKESVLQKEIEGFTFKFNESDRRRGNAGSSAIAYTSSYTNKVTSQSLYVGTIVFDDVNYDAKKSLYLNDIKRNLWKGEKSNIDGKIQWYYALSVPEGKVYLWYHGNVLIYVLLIDVFNGSSDSTSSLTLSPSDLMRAIQSNTYAPVTRDDTRFAVLQRIAEVYLKSCSSKVEESCWPLWEQKVEPAICPEYGEQKVIARDVNRCSVKSTIEETKRCSPGICSGCSIPRFLGFADTEGDNVCVPYSTRLAHQQNGVLIPLPEKNSVGNGVFDYTLNVDSAVSATLKTYSKGKQTHSYLLRSGGTFNLEDFSDQILKLKVMKIVYSGAGSLNNLVELQTIENFDGYCNYNGRVLPQKGDDASCQNNYECFSNECNSGTCVNTYQNVVKQAGFLLKLWCRITNIGNEEGYLQCLKKGVSG